MISICFLFSGLAILLGVIVTQEQRIDGSGDALFTKGVVLKCTSLAESSISNNLEKRWNIECYEENGKIIAEFRGKRKTIELFTWTNLEEHYGKGNDFFD
jgi:hypothetical protein